MMKPCRSDACKSVEAVAAHTSHVLVDLAASDATTMELPPVRSPKADELVAGHLPSSGATPDSAPLANWARQQFTDLRRMEEAAQAQSAGGHSATRQISFERLRSKLSRARASERGLGT